MSTDIILYKNALSNIITDFSEKNRCLSWVCADDVSQTSFGWSTVKGKTFIEIAKNNEQLIKNSRVYISPITWDKRRRKEEHYWNAYGLGMEIDDGFPLNSFLEIFDDVSGFCHTSKSHQLPKKDLAPCDRYHAFLEFNKPVVDVDRYRIIAKYLLKLFDFADPCTYDGARQYKCVDGCQIFYLKGTKYIDVDKCYEEAVKLGIESGSTRELSFEPVEMGEINPDLQSKIDEYVWDQHLLDDDIHTYQKLWRVMLYAFSLGYKADEIAASLANIDWIRDYLQRHNVHMNDFLKQIGKAEACSAKSIHIKIEAPEMLKPKSDILTLNAQELPDLISHYYEVFLKAPLGMPKLLMGLTGPNDKTDMYVTAQVIQHLCENNISCRLDLGCGVGKSTAMLAYMAAFANVENRFWLARKTRREAIETQIRLKEWFGVESTVIHGLDRSTCTESPTISNDLFYDSHKSPCRKCQNRCPFGIYRYNYPELSTTTPIIITTHEMIIELHSRNKVPADVRLVFDEQIQRIITHSANTNWYKNIRRTIRKAIKPCCRNHYKLCRAIRRAFGKNCEDWRNLNFRKQLRYQEKQIKSDQIIKSGGVSMDRLGRFDEIEANHYQNMIHKLRSDKQITETDKNSLMDWFRYQNTRAKSWIIADSKNILMTKDRFNFENWFKARQVLILDGSASLDIVNWDIPIIRINGMMERNYSLANLHVFPCLPTKQNTSKYIPMMLAKAEETVVDPCVITNANPSDIETEWINVNEAVHLTIGQGGRGSNAAVNCDSVIITSSLFSNISSVAGTAAAINDEPISPDQIWTDKKPRWNQGGFIDPKIKDVMMRQIIDLAQQVAHRGKIRNNPQNSYDIFVMIPDWQYLSEFLKYCPVDTVEIVDLNGRKKNKSLHLFSELWNETSVYIDLDDVKEISKKHIGKGGRQTTLLGQMLGVISALKNIKKL